MMIWLKTQCFFFVDYLKTVWNYYRNRTFAKVDFLLRCRYFFQNPFRISRQFLEKRGESDIYAYGETPLITLDHICKECGMTKDDVVFELGCGRGITCFWLNLWLGCEVVGIEYIPKFVENAQTVVQTHHLKGIRFRLEDMLETDLTGATIIYLYGTCLDDESIQKLVEKFSQLPKGTKIITTSYSLPAFEITHRFKGRFAWGQSAIYCHQIGG